MVKHTQFLVVKALDSQSRGPLFKTSVAPKSTQPFIFLRSIKRVTGISGDLVVKSKLSPQMALTLRQVNPIHKKGP